MDKGVIFLSKTVPIYNTIERSPTGYLRHTLLIEKDAKKKQVLLRRSFSLEYHLLFSSLVNFI